MCGILAVFNKTTPKELSVILERSKLLRPRGPDRNCSYVREKGIYFFHRLCINDLTTSGDQPFFSDEIMLMCNGEIYNSEKLVKEFDLKCVSRSDCEVILHLYRKIGFTETVKQLDGVYAIVLVDGNDVYLARDKIGIRPLYYGYTEEGFLSVASTPECLDKFCRDIIPFPPGNCAQGDFEGRIEMIREREFVPEKMQVKTSTLYYALRESVKKRLHSDRPVGCLLSGGLDSSCVAVLLCELLGAKNVRTYSIGMECSTDLKYAREVAKYLGTDHKEVIFTPEEGFDAIPEIVKILGCYDITTIRASVGMYLIAKYISKNTDDRVIFSGEGSDELFGGYLYFHNAPSAEEAKKESVRLLENLHVYDVLRADRTISSNGLELRVPFLDQRVIQVALSMDKLPIEGYEKYMLRKAFEGKLPENVLWRRKEGFSDGVSGLKKSWYEYIQEMVDLKIKDEELDCMFPSKEAMYYRLLFESNFTSFDLKVPYWMPKWSKTDDPSGRKVFVIT